MSEFDFQRKAPTHISPELWDQIIDLNVQAVNAAYPQDFTTLVDVRRATGVDDKDAYVQRMTAPKRGGQLYSNPTFTLAFDQKQHLSAVVYTANNTSGKNVIERHMKMAQRPPLKRWAWFGWVATSPPYQRSGLAFKTMGHALDSFHPDQPVSAYAWPSRIQDQPPLLDVVLRSLALEPTEDLPSGDLTLTRYIGASIATSRQAASQNWHHRNA